MELPVDIDRLAWDDWNLQHLRDRHQITREEVEQVLQNENSVAQETYKARYLVLGTTAAGRILAVVVGPVPGDPGAFYTFSARPAHRKERALYQAQTELHDHE
jgi:uncharacterized DUF497 family protein